MSILTSYRPNFCCECGDKIVRLRWFLWTSRKFCDNCFRTFAKAHWLQPATTIAVLVLFGVVIGRGCRSAPPPVVIQRTAPMAQGSPSGSTADAGDHGPTTEQLYTCGARTKKGTPCSRRVHGPVRCWQHKGVRAMLPLEKLMIKE